MARLLGVGLFAGALFAGCAWLDVELPAPTGDPTGRPVGRTACPGSVPSVVTNLRGAITLALEELQATYGSDPGFIAVVFDGAEPIIIVSAATLPDWQLRMAPLGLAVAPSCVDVDLLAAVHAVLPSVRPPLGTVSAGYNALDDSIHVDGIDAETFLAALEEQFPGAGDGARAAIAAGTLRIDEREIPSIR